MLTPDYSKCLKRSIIYSRRLQRLGFSPTIRYGTFKPTTPPNMWDERWQIVEITEPEFTHVWLEIGIFIVDMACAQFGEPIPGLYLRGDSRYYPVGVVEPVTLDLIPDPIDFTKEYRVCTYKNGLLVAEVFSA